MTLWYTQEEGYKKFLQKLSERALLSYFTKSDFWGVFYPEDIYLLKRHPYSDGTPEVFYEFVMEQPIPLIQKLIDYAKSDKPVHDDTDYQEISLMVYKQVSKQLEARLQYRLLDEKLLPARKIDSSKLKI